VAVVVEVAALAVAVAVTVAVATSRISARASHLAHTTTADVSIGYLMVGGVTHFASPKNEKKTEEKTGHKTTTD